MQMIGLTDMGIQVMGNKNPICQVKALHQALSKCKSARTWALLRGQRYVKTFGYQDAGRPSSNQLRKKMEEVNETLLHLGNSWTPEGVDADWYESEKNHEQAKEVRRIRG